MPTQKKSKASRADHGSRPQELPTTNPSSRFVGGLCFFMGVLFSAAIIFIVLSDLNLLGGPHSPRMPWKGYAFFGVGCVAFFGSGKQFWQGKR